MNREEAIERLKRVTRFQVVGGRLVTRDLALLESIAAANRVEEEKGVGVWSAREAGQARELARYDGANLAAA